MQEFERGVQVRAEDAKQDRIALILGSSFFATDELTLDGFLNFISTRTWQSINGEEHEFTPFVSAQRFGSRWKVKLRSQGRNGNVQDGSPLAAGNYIVQRYANPERGASRFVASAELTLNPSRALVYQPINPSIIRAFRTGDHTAAQVEVPQIVAEARAPLIRRERPLNPTDDNVIIDRHEQMMADPRYWRDFRNGYIARVALFFREMITTAQEQFGENIDIHHRTEVRLQELETYWEFRSSDPIGVVRRLEPTFRSLGTASEVREYADRTHVVSRDGNIPVLEAQLLGGVKGVIYPKTTGRIRLEIRYDLSKVSGRGNTFEAFDDFLAAIDEIAEESAVHANQLLEIVTVDLPPAPEPVPAYELVRQVVAACDSAFHSRSLLSILVNQLGYNMRQHDPLRYAIGRLVREGVLIRGRPRATYFLLTGEYRAAARLLAQDPALTGIDDQ
jgi:hypothetical protein